MLDRLEAAVSASGGRLIYSSLELHPRVLPAYFGIEITPGERFGVLCYAFRATTKPTRNRPSDEHRVQVRYGRAPWLGTHQVARDIAGVDVTLLLGVHR